jgi:hypothetical protein
MRKGRKSKSVKTQRILRRHRAIAKASRPLIVELKEFINYANYTGNPRIAINRFEKLKERVEQDPYLTQEDKEAVIGYLKSCLVKQLLKRKGE